MSPRHGRDRASPSRAPAAPRANPAEPATWRPCLLEAAEHSGKAPHEVLELILGHLREVRLLKSSFGKDAQRLNQRGSEIADLLGCNVADLSQWGLLANHPSFSGNNTHHRAQRIIEWLKLSEAA